MMPNANDEDDKLSWPAGFEIYYTAPTGSRLPEKQFNHQDNSISKDKYTLEFRIPYLNELYFKVQAAYDRYPNEPEKAEYTLRKKNISRKEIALCHAYENLISFLNNSNINDINTTYHLRDKENKVINNSNDADNESYYVFNASGTRNCQHIAQHLIDDFEFKNKELASELTNIANANKKFSDSNRPAPTNAENIDDYELVESLEREGKTPIGFYTKKSEHNLENPTEYVFKQSNRRQHHAELEAYNAAYHQIITPGQFAGVIPVQNQHGEMIGTMSKAWTPFTDLHTLVHRLRQNEGYENFSLDYDFIKNHKLIKLWVAAYTEKEIDLHIANYGLQAENEPIVRIDADRSTFSLTGKYFGANTTVGGHLLGETPVDDFFPITPAALSQFPVLENKTDPYYWYDRNENANVFSEDLTDIFLSNDFKNDKEMQTDMWMTFLRRAFIPNKANEELANRCITNKNLIDDVIKDKKAVTEKLLSSLPNVAAFRAWFSENASTILQELLSDYAISANSLNITIDPKEVEDRFNKFNRSMGFSNVKSDLQSNLFKQANEVPASNQHATKTNAKRK